MKCPTLQLSGFGTAMGLPGHHWTVVASAGTDIGLKAAVKAGMTLAQFAYDIFHNQKIIDEAWEEFHEDYKEPYVCKIPKY